MATGRNWGRTQRYTAVLVVWAAMGILAGGLRYVSRPPTYEVSARLYVHHLGDGEPGDFARNVEAIRSQAISAEAARRIQGQTETFLGKEQLNGRKILHGLAVSPEDIGTTMEGLVTIRYQAGSPEESEIVLDAVLASYLDRVRDLQHPFSADFLARLEYAQERLLPLLRTESGDDREPAELPEWLARDVGSQTFRDQYTELQGQMNQLEQQRARLEGELIGLAHAQSEGLDESAISPTPSAPRATPPSFPSEPRESDVAAELRETMTAPLRKQITELSQRYGPDHLQLKQARQKLEYMRSIFETEPLLSREFVELLVELHLLREQYGSAHPMIIELEKQIDSLRESLREQARESAPSQEVVTAGAASGTGLDMAMETTEVVSADLPEEGTSPDPDPHSRHQLREARVRAQLASVEGEIEQLRPLLERAHTQRLYQVVTNHLDAIQWAREKGGISVHVLDEVGEAREVSRSFLAHLALGGIGGILVGGLFCLMLQAAKRERPAA